MTAHTYRIRRCRNNLDSWVLVALDDDAVQILYYDEPGNEGVEQ